MKIIEPPDNTWVTRLRPGNEVYLTKQCRLAVVLLAWQKPEPGHRGGTFFIQIDGAIQRWYVMADGTGFDGSTLMEPVDGHLPDLPAHIDEDRFTALERRVKDLERIVLLNSSGWAPKLSVKEMNDAFLTHLESIKTL